MHALMLVAGITVIHAALFAMMLIFMSSGKGNVEGLNKAGEWLHHHESAKVGSTHILAWMSTFLCMPVSSKVLHCVTAAQTTSNQPTPHTS
jgi:sugar phosphate permease